MAFVPAGRDGKVTTSTCSSFPSIALSKSSTAVLIAWLEVSNVSNLVFVSSILPFCVIVLLC